MSDQLSLSSQGNYWLVIDTVRIPDALEALRGSFTVQQAMHLFSGEKLAHLLDQSPLVLNLGSDANALQCLALKEFASSSVVFEVSQQCDEMTFLEHLQSVFLANIETQPCLLRFYTSAFWQPIFSQINDEDIKTLLGPSSSVIWMDANNLQQVVQRQIGSELPQQPYVLTSEVFKSWV